MIRAIAAIDDKYGLAAVNHPPYDIPWDIPADRTYYRQKTEGSIVVMGRSTYEKYEQPLPNRRNVVVSGSLNEVRKGFELVSNLEDFLQSEEQDIWIIGGAKLYESALGFCDELYITHVRGDYDCDTFFPMFSADFSLVKQSTEQADNGYTFRFAVYNKNR